MASPIRFLFDQDFAEKPAKVEVEEAPPPEPTITLAEHERLIADAREQARMAGYAAGEVAGRKATEEAEAARLGRAIERLAGEAAKAMAASDAKVAAVEAQAIAVAVALAKKLGGVALTRFPLADIEAAATLCFTEARQAPHVAVRVHDAFVEVVQKRLAPIAAEKGFQGRLIVLGDPNVEPGDARLEWADGGIVRDRAAVQRAIETAIATHLGAAGAAPRAS